MEHGLHRLGEGFPLSICYARCTRYCCPERGVSTVDPRLRSTPVWIGGNNLTDAVFVPPPPEVLGEALDDLERFLRERDQMPLLVQLALAHYQFEAIHPFPDGNGRIGRLLIPLMLVMREALPQPLLNFSVYLEQRRSQYYDHLLLTSQKGDFIPWLTFFLHGVVRLAEVLFSTPILTAARVESS